MIAFAGMLVDAAEKAGIKVPNPEDKSINIEDVDSLKDEYPHFYVFCLTQLGSPQPYPGCHFDNAKVIAKLGSKKIKTITMKQLVDKGLRIGFNDV